jgi:hypothetical protein
LVTFYHRHTSLNAGLILSCASAPTSPPNVGLATGCKSRKEAFAT